MNQLQEMLIRCRDQFAFYAQNHRDKAKRFGDLALEYEQVAASGSSPKSEEQRELQRDALRKAEVNEAMAKEIDEVLSIPLDQGALERTVEFATIAYADGISHKNQQTQIGVHFEEVAEMLPSLKSFDPLTQYLLNNAQDALTDLASALKNAHTSTLVVQDRLEFIDACADQFVTASLSAALQNMDIVGALQEVNRSNFSKLTNGVMEKAPTTAKWVKGPDYSPPELSPFI